jgi:uncharacterized membrane protein (UPF0127 family)
MFKKLLVILFILFILVSACIGAFIYSLRQEAQKTPPQYSLVVKDQPITVELALTPEEWSEGLANRDYLPTNHGMLFVTPQISLPSFWMYGMRFPLDIIWIRDEKVIGWEENVPAPSSETSNLPTYRPPQAVDMVLEVNAGWVQRHQLQQGDTIQGLAQVPKEKTTKQLWAELIDKWITQYL